ncbi:hypothetical protein EV361DRAFT_931924 [Lentinula raphanica]|uniref:SMODS and SLOG-associating 2TM effector domain-containing protein n=1 Tax=Lentinula raphanica TaxID=153919 RepID=A0AA38UI12_9AGAR|nr:hypothetical protein F5878DRAFT_382684 [Lentinula raphanica]KAJ3967177.1 hypothetical protein EV361DRAFT_931924 [Lentinula raphanica]
MDLIHVVKPQLAQAGSQSTRPEGTDSHMSQQYPTSPGFGIEGPQRASPTNFDVFSEDGGSPGVHPSQIVGNQHDSLPPLPLPPPAARVSGEATRGAERSRTADTTQSAARRSNIDWIVPLEPERKETISSHRPKTVGERLLPTLDNAKAERTNYAIRARMTGIALNVAIGLQVLLGALTTALSAATSGKQTSIAVSVLGGLSTLVASYLARARGSNEPELSTIRVKDLDEFIRECKAFEMDFGHCTGDEYDEKLQRFRTRFEELLGNANGERRLARV